MKTLNSIPEICELVIQLEPTADEDGNFNCMAELRLYYGDIPIGKEQCQVSIVKAIISIDMEGLTPVPGSRFNEPRKTNSVLVEKSTNQTNSIDKKYKAGAEVKVDQFTPSANLSIEGAVSGASARETKLATSETTEHFRVRAIPNLKWEVREVDDSNLSGTYLEGNSLISLSKPTGANRSSLTAVVTVKQRDLNFEQIMVEQSSWNFFGRLNINQRKLLNIFIAKSLSAALNGDGKYYGEIKLSEHTSVIDNEE